MPEQVKTGLRPCRLGEAIPKRVVTSCKASCCLLELGTSRSEYLLPSFADRITAGSALFFHPSKYCKTENCLSYNKQAFLARFSNSSLCKLLRK